MAKEITNISDLRSILYKPYIFLCGSAISGKVKISKGKSELFLPLANNVFNIFYKLISIINTSNGYINNLMSRYTSEMVKRN